MAEVGSFFCGFFAPEGSGRTPRDVPCCRLGVRVVWKLLQAICVSSRRLAAREKCHFSLAVARLPGNDEVETCVRGRRHVRSSHDPAPHRTTSHRRALDLRENQAGEIGDGCKKVQKRLALSGEIGARAS